MPVNLDRLSTGGAFGPLARAALPVVRREPAAGDRLGAFRIIQEISRGGMAVVYLAERCDGEFEQRVALKWMTQADDHDIAEAMFRRERDIVAGLEHPGIARLIDGGRDGGGPWFAMELVDGLPIDQWCLQHALPLGARLRLFVELCDALAFAHARLLIHRDIKPGNVLVSGAGRLKLLDFGIARLADQRDLIGNAALTPRFASPEQWRGEDVTVASDIFQAGLLLAILAGALHGGDGDGHITCLQTTADLADGVPRALPASALARLPRDLAAIIACATALQPAERYATVQALADDVRRFLARLPVAARNGGVFYRTARLLRRHPFTALLAAASLCALLVLGWRLAVERDAARAEAARANLQADHARAVVAFVTHLLKWAKPTVSGGDAVTVDQALRHGVERLREDTAMSDHVRARLSWTLGQIYVQRRERDLARPLLEASLTLQRADPEADPALMALTALNLASTLSDAGDRQRSIALLDEAYALLDGDAELIGQRIDTRRIKSIRLFQQGDLAGSIAAAETALADARALLPPGDPTIASLQLLQAQNLADFGRARAAAAIFRDVLDASEAARGADDTVAMRARSELISTTIELGELDAAGGLLERERALLSRLFGNAHPEYAQWHRRRAHWQLAAGRLREARHDAMAALAIADATGAQGMTTLFSSCALLGRIERAAGQPAAAERALRRALQPSVHGASLGNDFGGTRLALVQALLDLGRIEEADREWSAANAESRPLATVPARRALLALIAARFAYAAGDTAGARRDVETARVAWLRSETRDRWLGAEIDALALQAKSRDGAGKRAEA
jgi:tRNA A-37 threonylcarbamoyl transferase component Bud32